MWFVCIWESSYNLVFILLIYGPFAEEHANYIDHSWGSAFTANEDPGNVSKMGGGILLL